MTNSRGSIWRRCDFHIHTPFSALENNFGSDFDAYVKSLFKNAIEKNVAVIGITDYFTIDGYKKIRTDYLEDDAKLKRVFTEEEIVKIRKILVLPNIEFRLNKIIQVIKTNGEEKKSVSGRVNFHVIFSEKVSITDIEESFLHDIHFTDQAHPAERDKTKPLKFANLVELGKRLKAETPGIHGTDAQIGMMNAVVDDKEIMDILTGNNVFKDKYLVAVPSDEDLSVIDWKSQDGLTRKILLSKAHVFLSSNPKTIAFGLGEKSSSTEDFLKEFKSLKPCIWGSDAHDYDKLFEPDKERYCWIKGDASFEGIRQILFEPKDRAHIGKDLALRDRIVANRGYYIDSLEISSVAGYDGNKGEWFNNFKLQIGWELTAIIGNKGKGKSALADIIGLLGNAYVDRRDFSFLNNDKFCQRGFAENFIGKLNWFDGTKSEENLNSTIDPTDVERVKYIPQSYLEKLCNNEGSGFNEEINKVVFSRLDDSDKLGKTTFSELEDFHTQLINDNIAEHKNRMLNINKWLITLEAKQDPDFRKSVENKLAAKRQELANYETEKNKIKVVVDPEADGSATQEQRQKAEKLGQLITQITELESSIDAETKSLNAGKIILAELNGFKNEIISTSQKFEEWKKTRVQSYAAYNLNIDDIINLTYDTSKVDTLIAGAQNKIDQSNKLLSTQSIKTPDEVEQSYVMRLQTLNKQKEEIEKELAKPFKDWQEYQSLLKTREKKKAEIIGTADQNGTIAFFEKELDYVDKTLTIDIASSKDLRKTMVADIFNQKQQIQQVYNKMKEAISDILQAHSKEQNITIETSFKVDTSFYNQFFDYVNRYGEFYQNGDENIRKIMAKYDFDSIEQVQLFLEELLPLDIRYKDGRKQDFYNFIFSLDYLQPEYDLRLNGKGLNKLSPGEKGGLLLVFYLVLDKNNKPLIIDQPEDNLDNQSVAEILVPYIKSAKKKRQIIMVTHNPNLAIVADAEQIIYMNIDKDNNYLASCISGGIENPVINNKIVDILEGKMKAFDNRRVKYKK